MDKDRAIRQLKALERLGGEMRLAAEGWNQDWKTLVSIIMSAQTKDETTIPVAQGLFKEFNGVSRLANARVEDVEKLIRRVNYHKTKARNVIACCKILVDKFNGRVPHDLDLLIELPGVGRKTANVFLASLGRDAIGVDTHLSYISRNLGWTTNKDPHKIEMDLETLFPKSYWKRLNEITVRFGKEYTSRKEKDNILDKIRSL